MVFVDGGSRNGVPDLPTLKAHGTVFGFEPNMAEFKNLKSDANKTNEDYPIQKGKEYFYPTALSDRDGEINLNITLRPGGSSTLEPNHEELAHFKKDNWSQISNVVKKETVPSVSLGKFTSEQNIDRIDYLKLDTQGNEYEILTGLGKKISTVGVIKVEVEFIELYKNQKLFADILTLLNDNGFQFVDLQVHDSCRRFHSQENLEPTAYRLIWGDGIFVRSPYDFNDKNSAYKALVLADLGYRDLAIYIAENCQFNRKSELLAFIKDRPKAKGLLRNLNRMIQKLTGFYIRRDPTHKGKQVRNLLTP